uniref:Uncharacterized protein n=1 Tax=Macrostomum lignano TaxID=282301 RepID=A0A1I8F1W7_9PLAT
MEENFYFAVFNLVGHLVKVSELKLLVGGAGSTNYSVSLASNAQAHELRCKSAGLRLIHWTAFTTDGSSAGELENVSSLMIRSEPLVIQMRLLEVVAYSDDRQPIPFAYCSVAEPGVCGRARWTVSWLRTLSSGCVRSSRLSQLVRRLQLVLAGVCPGVVCANLTGQTTVARPSSGWPRPAWTASGLARPSISKDGVEAIDFACTASKLASSSLVEVWELDADFLVNLCENSSLRTRALKEALQFRRGSIDLWSKASV